MQPSHRRRGTVGVRRRVERIRFLQCSYNIVVDEPLDLVFLPVKAVLYIVAEYVGTDGNCLIVHTVRQVSHGIVVGLTVCTIRTYHFPVNL